LWYCPAIFAVFAFPLSPDLMPAAGATATAPDDEADAAARPSSQCTHTLGTKDEENNNLQTTLLVFVACFRLFCVLGL
jgi:hypothetical protein